jgi:hypothetical protein
MRSFKNHAAPIMMKMGPVKLMAVMSAMGMCGKAMNHSIKPAECTPPRQNWPLTLVGQYERAPERSTKGNRISKAHR